MTKKETGIPKTVPYDPREKQKHCHHKYTKIPPGTIFPEIEFCEKCGMLHE